MVRKTLSWRGVREVVRKMRWGNWGLLNLTYCTFKIIKWSLSPENNQGYSSTASRHTCTDTLFRWIYQAALKYLRPLQSYCDAVGEDEGQHHIVKQLMGDNGLAYLSEPGVEGEERR